jgi:hypothetical protein
VTWSRYAKLRLPTSFHKSSSRTDKSADWGLAGEGSHPPLTDWGWLWQVSIYNWPGLACCGGDVVKMLATMDTAFKEGTAVCILEPFFKTRMDGTRGVRVDNPAAELVLDVAAPKSSADWKAEGNAHVGYLPRRYPPDSDTPVP